MYDDTKIYKDIIAEVTIDAKMGRRDQAIETRSTFFSYDAHSGLVKINLKKDDQPLPIPVGSEVLVSPRKLTGEPGKLVYDNNELDRENGIVYWMIPDQLRGYVGKIRTFVGVRYPNEQRIHGGYFNFSMDISDIDEDIPEWEPYYWQKWEDFQAEAELEWDQWKQAQVDKQDQFEAETTERLDGFITETNGKMSQLTDELTEAQDDIDQIQTDIVSGKVVTEEKMIGYWMGDLQELSGVANFVGKEVGSFVENPHWASFKAGQTLYAPSDFVPDNYTSYPRISVLDDVINTSSNGTSGNTAQVVKAYNLIEQINRDYPGLYESVGAIDLAAKVAFVKRILTKIEYEDYGFGSSATGNKYSTKWWLDGRSWQADVTTNTASAVAKNASVFIDQNRLRVIDDQGFVYVIAYADPSDGITASAIRTDYAQLAYKLDLSMYEFVPGWQNRPMVYKDVLTGNFDWNSVKETGYYYVKNYIANTSSPPSFLKKTGLLVVHSVTDDEGIKIAQTYEPAGAVYSRNDEKVKRNTADGSFNNVNWSTDTGYWRDELVITHGEQTIGGIKNFTDTPLVNESPILVSNDTGWIQVPLNPGYAGWFFVRKRAGIITWQFYIGLGTNSAGPNSIVCTVPEGFRTSLNHTKVLGGNATTAPATAQVRVIANGNIAIWHTDTPGSMYSFVGDFGDYENPENI